MKRLLVLTLALGCASPEQGGDDTPEAVFQKVQDTLKRSSSVTFDFVHADVGESTIVSGAGTMRMMPGNKVSVSFRDDRKEIVGRFRSDGSKMAAFRPWDSRCDRLDAPADLVPLLQHAMFRWFFVDSNTLLALGTGGKEAAPLRGSRSTAGFRREMQAVDLEMLSYDVHVGLGAPPVRASLWYDPRGHRPLKIRMTLETRGLQWAITVDNIELDLQVPESEFALPPHVGK